MEVPCSIDLEHNDPIHHARVAPSTTGTPTIGIRTLCILCTPCTRYIGTSPCVKTPSSCLSSPYPLTHYQALVGARSIACVLVICYHFFSDFRDGKPIHACTAAANHIHLHYQHRYQYH